MTIHNMEVADKFNKLANLLEIKGENPFRIRAYRNAARIIGGLTTSVAEMIANGEDLTELPGIGDDLAGKIKTIVKTGELPILTRYESRMPPILNDLMSIEGLGPRRVKIIYSKLKIRTTEELKKAIAKGRLKKIRGFGDKMEQMILRGLEHKLSYTRLKLADILPIAGSLLTYMKKFKIIQLMDVAGSFRRRKETIGDLDLLIATKHPEEVIEHFVKYDEVASILSQGTTKAAVRLHSDLRVDLRVIPKESYGAALIYFTGSKEHNIVLRGMGLKKKLKINEYGVYKGKNRIAGKTEKEVYAQVGLPFIDPELREDRGEFAAAKAHQLPKLIALENIRGDLHCHTNATDGTASLEEMVRSAEARGYEYIAITDHSMRLAMTHGFDKKALFKQIKAIEKLNAKFKKITILKSIEVDILENGKLDLPDDVLAELDLTVCAIHSKFNLSEEKQTERILRAMDNRYFTILAHPTGRIINQRQPYPLNIERVIDAAHGRGCILELNAQPNRLDLNDVHCKLAKERKVKIAINTDAHSVNQLDNMQFGIYQARRGWLEASNVINTLNLQQIQKLFAKIRS